MKKQSIFTYLLSFPLHDGQTSEIQRLFWIDRHNPHKPVQPVGVPHWQDLVQSDLEAAESFSYPGEAQNSHACWHRHILKKKKPYLLLRNIDVFPTYNCKLLFLSFKLEGKMCWSTAEDEYAYILSEDAKNVFSVFYQGSTAWGLNFLSSLQNPSLSQWHNKA